MRLTHRQLEAFRFVFQTGRVTAAAELIGVTQPAVSRLIRDLEGEIAMTLFERTGVGLRATPEAVALYREVERSFIGLDRVARSVADIRQRRPGVLRLAASIAPALHALPKVMAAFHRDWPGVGLSLHALPSAEVLDRAGSNQVDFGIADAPSEAPGVTIELVGNLEFVCVLPIEHRLTAKHSVTPQDIAGEPLLMVSSDRPQHNTIVNALKTSGITPKIVIEASSNSPICALVAEGVGVSIVDPITASAYRDHGVALRKFLPEIPYALKLIYPANRSLSEQGQSFVHLLRCHLTSVGPDSVPSSRECATEVGSPP